MSAEPASAASTPSDDRAPGRAPLRVPRGPGGRPALVGRRVFRGPMTRRVVYAVVFELLAIAFTTGILAVLRKPGGSSFSVAVVSSAVALTLNAVFKSSFEHWERLAGVVG